MHLLLKRETIMSEHIMSNREGPYVPEEDPTVNPVGALFELFLAGRYADGTPLIDDEKSALGSGLYDEYLKVQGKGEI